MSRHRVHRSTPQHPTRATLVASPPVRLIFQKYPGVAGSDAVRAIGNVPFRATYGGGRPESQGNTNPDGSIEIHAAPDGSTRLMMFDTEYQVVPEGAFSPAPPEGALGRLRGLGYGDLMDSASAQVCAFEDDEARMPLGGIEDDADADARAALRARYGE